MADSVVTRLNDDGLLCQLGENPARVACERFDLKCQAETCFWDGIWNKENLEEKVS